MKIGDLVPWKETRPARLGQRREMDPFYGIQQEFDRLFNELSSLSPLSWRESDIFTPAVNVTERANVYEVTAELPGLTEEDIDIQLTKDILTIKGEKRAETEEEEGSFYRRERVYGSFVRSIPLPSETVDAEKVEATFKNGVLVIKLPKIEPEQRVARRISVKSG